jgi:hypothetical protein
MKYPHKLCFLKKHFPIFPPEIIQYIINFLPIYDRYYLSENFAMNLETQLVECRNDRYYIDKYMSYYDNIRPSLLNNLKMPWETIESHIEYFELFGETLTYFHTNEYRFTLDNFVYSTEFHNYQQDFLDDFPYRQTDLSIHPIDEKKITSSQVLQMVDIFYQKRIRFGEDIYCTLNHYITELMPFSCSCDIDNLGVTLVMYVDAPFINHPVHSNYSIDEEELYDFFGKNRLIQMSDRITHLLYTHIFSKIII